VRALKRMGFADNSKKRRQAGVRLAVDEAAQLKVKDCVGGKRISPAEVRDI
jgi:hypothetical protein